MTVIPSSLALTSIADGSNIVAADHRNNNTAIQTGFNSLLSILDDGAAGQVLKGAGTTLTWDYPPGYELGYAEFAANVTANAVAEASATSVVSAGAVTFDGSAVVVRFFCPGFALGGSSNQHGLNLWDGSTDLGRLYDGTVTSSSSGDQTGGVMERRLSPSAGSHTFSVRIWSVSATNFVALAGAGGAGTKLPGFIRIVKA